VYSRFTPEHRPAVVFILLISISIALILFNLTGKIQTIRSFVRYIFAPAPDLALRIIDHGEYWGENIVSMVRMREENIYLKGQVDRFAYLEKKYEAISVENRRLKKILGLKKYFRYDLISARVISHDSVNYFKSITVDKGLDSGIVADLPVITFIDSREALIGRVFSVDSFTSKILLITNELSAVPARIIKSGENGLIQGRSGPNLTMDYLFTDGEVRTGDEVITSGMGEVFSSGLYIGVVLEVKSTERGYFKHAVVRPNMKINKLAEVFVIKKSEKNR
jgi:rod shape-determining protein MreC